MHLKLRRLEIFVALFVATAIVVMSVLSYFLPGSGWGLQSIFLIPQPQITNPGEAEQNAILRSLTPPVASAGNSTTDEEQKILETLSVENTASPKLSPKEQQALLDSLTPAR